MVEKAKDSILVVILQMNIEEKIDWLCTRPMNAESTEQQMSFNVNLLWMYLTICLTQRFIVVR